MTDTFLHDWAKREEEKDRTFYLRNCRPRYENFRDSDGRIRTRVFNEGGYLLGNEWKQRRRDCHARAKGICERCRIRRSQIIHHLSYRNVGREFSYDLMALCYRCHEFIHFGTNSPNQLDLFVTQNPTPD